MKRRDFIRDISVLAAGSSLLSQCVFPESGIKGSILESSFNTGHLLRDHKIHSAAVSNSRVKTVIIGSGISALSAGRNLSRNQYHDYIMLELAPHTGGNAYYSENNVSAYPWAAHYVPIPNNNLSEYLRFLEESDVITGYDDKGLPVYNEYYLCMAPEERLYINGNWQSGLVPHFGVPERDRKQIDDFLLQMEKFRYARGADGKEAFAIPVDHSSEDDVFRNLDDMTMKEWLLVNKYDSEYLHWYCNYCCRDDFGTPHDLCSAWAGIHYFAARKGRASNADSHDVLTWPSGNGFLADKLKQQNTGKIKTGALVISVKISETGVEVLYYDVAGRDVHKIICDNCIVCTPQFVAQNFLEVDENYRRSVKDAFHYSPWMVANITANIMEERRGEDLSWDNVMYGVKSLGFVDATHQMLGQIQDKKVFTYYLPLTETEPREERGKLMKRSFEEWVDFIISELKPVYPDMHAKISNIDVMLWGHAMIQPRKGFINNDVRKKVKQPMGKSIFFAHTDIAGVSNFEEAFYQGLKASDIILRNQ